ncbi:MAG: LytR C-terminal domain-containing protein [Longimicrobiales bacterium]|nr:LytR C-terminal domain-containing protein [Longimicrobiales bacterium]
MSRGRRRGGGRGPRKKGVVAAIRLAASVIALTVAVAVGVHLATVDSGDVDRLRDPAATWSGERVRVEVYNGGGVTGMAREATGVLRDAGFDVVTYGNASSFDPRRPSEVVDRVGRTDLARAVAESLGIDNVQTDPDPNLYVDVTVVVGRDWTVPSPGHAAPDGEAVAPWWDPRQWF